MGKGIPDIVAGRSSCNGESGATGGREGSSKLEAGGRNDECTPGHTLSDHDRAHDAVSDEKSENKAEAGVDNRIHLLDRARRWMADAGAKAAASCREARAATESDAAHRTDIEG